MPTVADLQRKILEKVEQKHKSGVTRPTLQRIFGELDKDRDGNLTQLEFKEALVRSGNPLDGAETEFVFRFWDSMAGQRDETGMVEVELIVADLLASQPTYNTGFNSGDELIKANKGAKGNLPSQSGGIFSGGAYQADAERKAGGGVPATTGAPPMGYEQDPPAYASGRPRGNQSSIPGGIFGASEAPPASAAKEGGRSNRSNQSSIPGGIFGEAPQQQAQRSHRMNSNQSSIPGGIFG